MIDNQVLADAVPLVNPILEEREEELHNEDLEEPPVPQNNEAAQYDA